MDVAGKVWGSTSHIFGKNNVSIHRIEIEPGGYCSKHTHQHKYNMFFLESGELEVHVWKNDYDLVDVTTLNRSGDSTTVKPGEYHMFKSTSDTKSIVYEIYWTELDERDIERENHGGKNT